MLGWKGILAKATCLSMACNFNKSNITLNQLPFVPKHYAYTVSYIKKKYLVKKANNNKKPLALDPYTRKAPCSWSPVHLPTTTQSKIGWQLTPTPDKMAQHYHGKLGQGKGTTLTHFDTVHTHFGTVHTLFTSYDTL